MANSSIVTSASSQSMNFPHSSPFLVSRCDCGPSLPQSCADTVPVADCDVLSDEICLFGDDSFLFEDAEEEGQLGDMELRSPVEDKAPPDIFEIGRRIVPAQASNSSWSSAKGPVHACTTSDSSVSLQTSTYAEENPSSRSLKPDLSSRPVDIVSLRIPTADGRKKFTENGKEHMSARESLRVQAWERKRDHKHRDEMSVEKEATKPEQCKGSMSCCGKPLNSAYEGLKSTPRIRNFTDDDLDELRGFMDLGFRFSEACIPHLCETLPALEVYWAIKQTLDESSYQNNVHGSPEMQSPTSSSSPQASPWKVSSPGDEPDHVKARLKLWAHAVACNLRQSY